MAVENIRNVPSSQRFGMLIVFLTFENRVLKTLSLSAPIDGANI